MHSHARLRGGYAVCFASKSLHTCRRHGHRPAGNGAPGSDLAEHRCTRSGAAHQSQPVATEALGMSALCLQTSHSALHMCMHEPFNPALVIEICLCTLSNRRSSPAEIVVEHKMMCIEQMNACAMTQLHIQCHDKMYACPNLKERLHVSDQTIKTRHAI